MWGVTVDLIAIQYSREKQGTDLLIAKDSHSPGIVIGFGKQTWQEKASYDICSVLKLGCCQEDLIRARPNVKVIV